MAIRFDLLTREQARVLDMLEDNPRVEIRGGAGADEVYGNQHVDRLFGEGEGGTANEVLVSPRHTYGVVEQVADDAKRQPHAEIGGAKHRRSGPPAGPSARRRS